MEKVVHQNLFRQSEGTVCRLVVNNLGAEERVGSSPWKTVDYLVGGLCNSRENLSLDNCKNCHSLGVRVECSCAGYKKGKTSL